MARNKEILVKLEPFLFYLLCFIGILPVLLSKYFVTLDGPAHLYNGIIIKELIFDQGSVLNNLFEINSFPVPNWISHFLFGLSSLLLPAFLSEKAVLLLYLVITPIFFRKLILLYRPENKVFSYLGVIFVNNHLFYFGFFNMMFGIMFFFITLYLYLRRFHILNVKSILVLTSLFLLLYFSHILLLLFTILVVALHAFSKLFANQNSLSKSLQHRFKSFVPGLILVLLSSAPSLFLATSYFLRVDSWQIAQRLPISELLIWIRDIRPLLTVCYCGSWTLFTHHLLGLFILMIFVKVWYITFRKKRPLSENLNLNSGMTVQMIWFLLTIVTLILYFIVPNAILMTERLILLFFIFLIIWLSSLTFPKWIHILALVIIVVVHVVFSYKHYTSNIKLSDDVKKIELIVDHMEPDQLVLALNYNDHWLHSHSTGYIGSIKPMGVLENYEAGLEWFPVKWNTQKFHLEKMISADVRNKDVACKYFYNSNDTTCFSIIDKDNEIHPILYIVQFGSDLERNDDCTNTTRKIKDQYYKIVYENDFGKLYQLKK